MVRDAVDQHYDYSIWEKQKKHLTPEAVKRQLRKRVKIINPEDTEEAEK